MGNRIVNKTVRLDGVTCTSCETKIENKLRKMAGVVKAEVSYVTSTLAISYQPDVIKFEDIVKAIEKLDYKVVQDNSSLKSKSEKQAVKNTDKIDYTTGNVKGQNSRNQLLIMGIFILGVYMIIQHTVGFNFIPEVAPNMGYAMLFAVGLLSSLHCVAMCGGINLSLCVSYKFKKDDSRKFSKFVPSFMYNTGRVISYTIIGGIVGALGSVFKISNAGSAFISIAAGVFMVIMGLNMLNIFPWLRRLNPHMPKVFAKKIQSEKKNKGPFIVGLLNGLMPCGPLQAMQLYALGTGSFIAGASSMFAFSLGTVPLLFIFGALGSLLSSKFTKNMMKASAMLVIVLGFMMFNRGFAFTGFGIGTGTLEISTSSKTSTNISSTNSANSSTGNVADTNGSKIETQSDTQNYQEIKTELKANEYTPITVTVGVPVKWTITVEAKNLNGCNGQIVIPEYGIQQKLVVGENIIKFTPTKTGKFGYSCWMRMIRSTITVV